MEKNEASDVVVKEKKRKREDKEEEDELREELEKTAEDILLREHKFKVNKKLFKQRMRENHDACLKYPFQKEDPKYSAVAKHNAKKQKTDKDEEREKKNESIREKLGPIKDNLIKLLNEKLPDDKKELLKQFEDMDIVLFLKTFKQNIIPFSTLKCMLSVPINAMFDKVGMDKKDLKDYDETMVKLRDIIYEACCVIKKEKWDY